MGFFSFKSIVLCLNPAHVRFGKGSETSGKFCILSLNLHNCLLHFGFVPHIDITILKFASELDVEQTQCK